MANEVIITVKADDKASASLKGIGQQASGLGSIFKTAAGTALGFAGALGGIAAAKGIFNSIIGGAIESQKVLAQTEAVLKSTGGVSGMTAGSIAELAEQLQKLTPFEDEAIQSAENMLLTFTSIGKDIFPQATKTVLDMSTALGQDLQSSSIQLGKALNDPILGVTALRRVGVQFTDDQQAMIQSLVESGDKLGAQTLILKELQVEFGGSAEAAGKTFGGQLAILKNRLGDVAEGLGLKLLPVLTKLMGLVVNQIVPAVGKFVGWLSTLGKYLKVVAQDGDTLNDYLASLPGFLQPVAKVLGQVILALKDVIPWFVDLGKTAISIGKEIATFLAPALDTLADLWANVLQPALQAILPYLEKVWNSLSEHKAILIAVAGAILLLTNPWLAVAAAIVIVLAKWDEISKMFTQTIPQAIDSVITKIKELPIIGEIFKLVWNDVLAIVKFVWKDIQIVVETAINIVKDIIKIVTALIRGDWDEAWNGVKQLVTDIWDGITGLIGNRLNLIKELIGNRLEAIKGIMGDIWDLIGGKVTEIWTSIKDGVTSAAQTVKDWFSSNWPEIATLIAGPFWPIVALATDAFGVRSALINAMTEVKDWVSARVDDIAGFLLALPERVANVGRDFIYAVRDGAITAWDAVKSWFEGLPASILYAIGDLERMGWDIGRSLVQGIGDGILSMLGWLAEQAGKIPGIITGALGDLPGLSPSPFGIKVGEDFVKGIAVGMNNEMPALEGAVLTAVDAMIALKTVSDEAALAILKVIAGLAALPPIPPSLTGGTSGGGTAPSSSPQQEFEENLAGSWGALTKETVKDAAGNIIGYQYKNAQGSVVGTFFPPGGPMPTYFIPTPPGMGGGGGGSVAGFQRGGIVRRPTLAMLAEAGPEAVIPLEHGNGMGTPMGYGGGLGAPININLYIDAIDGASVERIIPELTRKIDRHLRGIGKGGLI